MGESGALVNIGELAKPATVLIEKISGAIGAVFEPHQIRRIARANADAAIIEANAAIDVTEIHRRAMIRFVQEEGKKQENIEAITSKAIPHLDENSEPNAVADDWISNFFDKGRLISDEEMQELWGKVLAGEANSPGTYSKRTVNLLESLDKQDALDFANVCRCGWMIGNVVPIIFDVLASEYSCLGISFNSLTHLDAAGLIRFESVAGFQRKGIPRRATVFYYGSPTNLEFSKDADNSLDVGHVMLTQAGQQLAPVCTSKPNDDVFNYVLDQWFKKGIIVSSPWPRRT